MKELIANKAMYYAGRDVKAEQTFECEDQHVDILVIAQAARVADEAVSKSRKYKRRDMVAEGNP